MPSTVWHFVKAAAAAAADLALVWVCLGRTEVLKVILCLNMFLFCVEGEKMF